MEMRVQSEDNVPILDIEGEIDHFVAPKLQRQIDELIDQGTKNLILDFSEVNYLDSGGIGVLFSAMKQLVPRSGHMGIVCQDPNVIRILELVGLFDERTNISLFSDRGNAKEVIERNNTLD
jgi:anti-anti-sigma factor